MKRKVVLSLAASAVVALSVIIVISCNKVPESVSVSNVGPNGQLINSSSSSAPLSPLNTCTCLPDRPSGCACAKKVIPNNISRDFTIKWTNCPSCQTPLPTNSTGILCFGDNCTINIQLADLPTCLQNCFGRVGCVNATIACNHGSYNIQFISQDGTQSVTITGDPHISIKCTDANGTTFQCEGEIMFTN